MTGTLQAGGAVCAGRRSVKQGRQAVAADGAAVGQYCCGCAGPEPRRDPALQKHEGSPPRRTGMHGKGQLLGAVRQKLRVNAGLVAPGVQPQPDLPLADPYGIEAVQHPVGIVLVFKSQQLVAESCGNTVGAQQCRQKMRLGITQPLPHMQNFRCAARNSSAAAIHRVSNAIAQKYKSFFNEFQFRCAVRGKAGGLALHWCRAEINDFRLAHAGLRCGGLLVHHRQTLSQGPAGCKKTKAFSPAAHCPLRAEHKRAAS